MFNLNIYLISESKRIHTIMKITIKILMMLAIIVSTSSFTLTNNYDFIGTYGVLSSDPSQIKLSIHSDHTYTYQDFSSQLNKIDIKGTWELKGSKVVLKDNASYKFHNEWSFIQNGQVAKSRKGLCFYRLCRLDN